MSGGKYIHKLKIAQRQSLARRFFKRAKENYLRWWRHNSKRYGLWWRVANGAVALLVLSSAIFPVARYIVESKAYYLSADTLKLVGDTDSKLAKKLSYDSSTQTYQFNKDVIPSSDTTLTSMQSQVGGASDTSKNLYAVDVSAEGSKGVTYYDANSGLSFSMIPEYSIGTGKKIDGHIVYPLDGDAQAIYTLKNNGLKEDIVVQKATQNTMSFGYTLKLPKTLEAKVIPNSGGAIGVYSADPTLTTNISYGSDADRAAVQKARENSEKSYLVFGLPAPVIKNTKGESVGSAHFTLANNTLTVVASGLSEQHMPVSIDPSVVVTSTADFQYGGNDDGNISFATTGQVTRSSLTGGSIGTWSTTTPSMPGIQYAMGFVAYNNYLYAIPGVVTADTYYTHIASDGTLDGWNTTNAPLTKRSYLGATAYNGYMYVWGGYDTTNSVAVGTAEYARINTDGTLGAWQVTSTMVTPVCRAASAAQGGYLYAFGGSASPAASCSNSSSGVVNTVQYAPIKADGTVGAWSTTTALAYGTSGAVMTAMAGAYNGYMYVMGGSDGPVTTPYSNVQYAPINADGTLGDWVAATSMPSSNYRGGFAIYDGYIYVISSQNSSTTVIYAPIYASGAVGSWRATTSIVNGRWGGGAVGYNGYLYFAGGTGYSEVDIAKINPAGQPSSFATTSTTFTAARALSCSVAYNGYIYAIGGSTTDSSNNNVTTVNYASLNATTGQTGTWSTTTALPVATGGAGCVAYDGYIYVVGGHTGTGTGSSSNVVRSVPINTNGTLGSWATKLSSGLSSIIPKLFVYSASGSTYLYAIETYYDGTGNDVMRATITDSSTGTIGSWTGQDNSLPALNARAFAQVGNHLYAIGGTDYTNHMDTVYYTSIASDGTIPDWQATTSLNTAISYSGATTVNGCIYSAGGEDDTGALAAVQYACPNADGTISAWHNAPDLSIATTDMGVTAYNGYIYGVGGYTTAVTNTTQFAYVDNGGSGSVGTWSSTSSFSTARSPAESVAYNGFLYVVGGYDGASRLNDVQYAPINSDGTIGTWQNTTSFTTARQAQATLAYNGFLYVTGGYDGTSQLSDVQYAPINSDGTIGMWQTTTSLSSARQYHSAVAYNGFLYVSGGYAGTSQLNDVQYAPINSDGTIGTWQTTTSLSLSRRQHSSVVYNNFLYIIGGIGDSSYLNDVQYAPINSDGTIGAWKNTTSYGGVRYGHSSVVYNGFLYVIGGSNSSSQLSDVQYAPINSDGTIGTWQNTTGFTTGRRSHTAVVYKGIMYILGGYSGSYLNDVQYAPIYSMARVGHYSKLIDLGASSTIKSITYSGTLPNSISPGTAPITYKTAASNGVFTTGMSYSNVATTANSCDTTSTAYTRYVLVSVTLDDSSGGGTSGGFSDSAGVGANLTDITITYSPIHVTPDIRLRAGQSLQNGSLTSLDTCYP